MVTPFILAAMNDVTWRGGRRSHRLLGGLLLLGVLLLAAVTLHESHWADGYCVEPSTLSFSIVLLPSIKFGVDTSSCPFRFRWFTKSVFGWSPIGRDFSKLIEEFPPPYVHESQGVVTQHPAGVQTDHRERQAVLDLGDGLHHAPVSAVLQCHVLGPAGEQVRQGKRVSELTRSSMSDTRTRSLPCLQHPRCRCPP